MRSKSQEVGYFFEFMAECYLQTQGLRCHQKNFRSRYGEIDLIMRDQNEWVFVEVRYKTNTHYVDPLESVHDQKQRRLQKAVWIYLQEHSIDDPFRIDFVGISPKENVKRLNKVPIIAEKFPCLALRYFKSQWSKQYNFEWIVAAF